MVEADSALAGARRGVLAVAAAAAVSVLAGLGFGGNLLYQAHGPYPAPPDDRWVVDVIVGFAFCVFAAQGVGAVRLFGTRSTRLARARRYAIQLGALGLLPLLLGGYMMLGITWEVVSHGGIPQWALAVLLSSAAAWIAGGAAPWLLLVRYGRVLRDADRAAGAG